MLELKFNNSSWRLKITVKISDNQKELTII